MMVRMDDVDYLYREMPSRERWNSERAMAVDDTQRDGISRETVSDDDGAGLMGDDKTMAYWASEYRI